MSIPRRFLMRLYASMSRNQNQAQEEKQNDGGLSSLLLDELLSSRQNQRTRYTRVRNVRYNDSSDDLQVSSDEDNISTEIQSLQIIPAEMHAVMEQARIGFSDTFVKCYGVLGVQTYLRLHKAGIKSSSSNDSRITSEELIKALLIGYLRNVKKLQEGKIYQTKMSEFIECLPSFTKLKLQIKELQKAHVEAAERKMKHCFYKVLLDIYLMYYQNVDLPICHMYREHILELALDFYQNIPEDLVKVVKKEIQENMNRVENERSHRGYSSFVDDNSFLNQSGIMIFETRQAYLEHLRGEQQRLRLVNLGCTASLFIS